MSTLPLFDERLVLAVAIVLFAGAVKSITGLGIPVVGTPLLVVLYGHLPLIVVLMSLPTTLCSGYFVVRHLGHGREAAGALLPLLPFGVAGVIVGSFVLVSVNPRILAGLLAIVITVFVATQWWRVLPRSRSRPAGVSAEARSGGISTGPGTVQRGSSLPGRSLVPPVVGLSAGGLQGASGASGPLVTMYLFSLPLSRPGFFLGANAVFLVLDSVQFLTLAGLGQFTSDRLVVGLLTCIPLFAGVAVGQLLARRIPDSGFRVGVLLILTATAVSLAIKAAG